MLIEWVSAACLLVGAAFFLAGTVGLLRFPDLYSRLHVLAKVDNIGLGFIVLGLMLRADSAASALKLALIWALTLAASGVVSFLIARRAYTRGIVPWTRGSGPSRK